MVKIKTYRDYWNSYLALLPSIKYVLLVSKESELAGKIKNLTMDQFPALVSIIPSADGAGSNVDAVTDKHFGLIYILKKYDSGSKTDESLMDDLEETQDILEAAKKQLLTDASIPRGMFYRLDVNSLHIDPEYDYLGCHGWSLSFKF